MHVVATAGHVDHGKSTLVRALTGMEPDRHEEERRRGMTIDLGFVWTTLPGGEVVAFVDVPGHERFVPTMLAGVGPVPAVLLVVAADEGWMPQTAEHVAALDALGVRHGVLAVTRSDLAEPGPVVADVGARLAPTSLAGLPAVPVSARTGAGLDDLVEALGRLVHALPAPDAAAPVRLWIDRSFTIRGSGTVVTGTLDAGTLRTGDELTLHAASGARRVRVRGLQSLGTAADRVAAVARVAVNLRGIEREEVSRGDVLATPGTVDATGTVDARLELPDEELRTPPHAVLHLGSAAVGVRIRLLDTDGGPVRHARLTLDRALPLAAGDVALLRDPGAHRIVARARVLDTAPPPLTRRGAGRARAAELAALSTDRPDGAALLARAGTLRVSALRAMGAEVPPDSVSAGDFVIDAAVADRWRSALTTLVSALPAGGGEPGIKVGEARAALGVPDDAIVAGLVVAPLAIRNGRVVDTRRTPDLAPAVAAAVDALRADLAETPFAAPTADRLAELGLGRRELAAAERAGAVVRVADGVVLLADGPERAAAVLAELPQPFTTSEARQALGTSRRVAIPLLELLDRRQLTRRLPDDRRTVNPR
ncbi:MAG TPA: selenocysteine-specific translation elongation factor [Kineosporiaceae bacterium]|nr:selenocysteine-specific translation elongation factor [Kineosporiaceae bacterium]